MRFIELQLAGAYEIRLDPVNDDRGRFVRRFSRAQFARRGLEVDFVERSVSFNLRRGTLRGLHFQAAPFGESKLVRCVKGAAFDVIVDLREASPTFGQWHGTRIEAEDDCMIYVPKGFAHGFQTLMDDTTIDYEITPEYRAGYSRGVRFDDPALSIAWPLPAENLSERDRGLPFLAELSRHSGER